MDERDHDLISPAPRVESVGTDLPAKSDLFRPKARYHSKKETPSNECSTESINRYPRTAQERQGQSLWKKGLPLSKDTTLEPPLPSIAVSPHAEHESTGPGLTSKSDPFHAKSKQFERASLSKYDIPCHGTSAHPLGPSIEISVWSTVGRPYHIFIRQNATISELRQRVQEKTGIPCHQTRLWCDGRIVGSFYGETRNMENLSAFDIRNNSELEISLVGPDIRLFYWEPESNLGHDQAQQQAGAISAEFDEDLYIVDPQSHFDMLRGLERDVVQRSEYFRAKREYNPSSAVDPADYRGVFLDNLGLRSWLKRKISRSMILVNTLRGKDPSSGQFWQFLKSYAMILNVCRGLEEMLGQRFCADAINILVAHDCMHVIEIRRIPLVMLSSIEGCFEAAVSQFLETDPKEISLALKIRGLALTPCRRLFDQVGHHIPESHAMSLSELLAMVREVASFLDVALVSYMRSHGSGFDSSYFGQDTEQLEVNYGNEMGFRCYWVKLACLHSFLDQKRVWTFDFLDKRSYGSQPRGNRSGSNLLLARMEDLADIWGPVYNVPTGTGLIHYYRVSKGVICRSRTKKKSPVPGATFCHYFSSFSLYKLGTRRLGIARDDLALSKDDLLLIGAGFRENQRCRYTMSAFTKESASRMTVLGTKVSVWRIDNRTLAVGLSKYFGVTISGTQKLIPTTTLKQHILDKWTTKPTRSNPAILNQYLGVEISHCTGNARRVSLKELMASKPLRATLQCQIPRWHEKPWGIAFDSAIHSPKSEDIVEVWKEYAADRCQMAELVCRLLEILDATGWNEQQVFNSAVLIDNEELAVQIPKDLNTWLMALHDTHLTSAYVIMTGICIEFEVSDRTTSICGASQAFTALQTQITAAESPLGTNAQYLLRSSGERFRQIDCGSSAVVLLTPVTRASLLLSFRTGITDFSEALNRARQDAFTQDVYLRASARSFRGRYEIKDTLLSKLSSALTRNRDASSIDQMSAVSSNAGGRRDQHNGLQLVSEERTPTSCNLIGRSGSHCVSRVSTLSTRGTTNGAITTNRQATLQESIEPHHITDTGADERMPTRRPDAVKNKTRRKLTNSDLQSRINDVRHGELPRRTAERSNISNANNHTPSRMRRRPTQGKIGEIQNNLANYTFTDDDEPGADDPMTLRRANQMPAIVDNPGWT